MESWEISPLRKTGSTFPLLPEWILCHLLLPKRHQKIQLLLRSVPTFSNCPKGLGTFQKWPRKCGKLPILTRACWICHIVQTCASNSSFFPKGMFTTCPTILGNFFTHLYGSRKCSPCSKWFDIVQIRLRKYKTIFIFQKAWGKGHIKKNTFRPCAISPIYHKNSMFSKASKNQSCSSTLPGKPLPSVIQSTGPSKSKKGYLETLPSAQKSLGYLAMSTRAC